MDRVQKFRTLDGKFASKSDRSFFTVDDFLVNGKTIILRVDINSSINPDNGEKLDDTRIKRHSTTVQELAKWGAKIVILAHQSRPGKLDFVNLKEHAKRMSKIINKDITFVPDLYGKKAIQAIKNLKKSDVIMLDNVRFDEEEIKLKEYNGTDFKPQAKAQMVEKLSPLADFFINDAFAAAHRCQPSLVGFSEKLPAIAGRVMQRELDYLGKAIDSGPEPRIALLGGSKAADSVKIAKNFIDKGINHVLTGGVVSNIFLIASGKDIGKPSTEFIKQNIPDSEEVIRQAKELVNKHRDKIEIPVDVAVNNDGMRNGINTEKLPSENSLYDIGLETQVKYIQIIETAGTVIVNGPMGVFENPEFAAGTHEIFSAVANSGALTVIGGGETVMAFNQMDLSSLFHSFVN